MVSSTSAREIGEDVAGPVRRGQEGACRRSVAATQLGVTHHAISKRPQGRKGAGTHDSGLCSR